jgi:putative spermidine/putrescine transport system ATP-binding protein
VEYLQLNELTKTFGQVNAVDKISLSVAKGEFVSLLGPSGCGKTTTLRLIAGFEKATQGTIFLEGEDISPIPDNKRNLGMVFQSYGLFPNLNVADNVGFGLDVRKMPKLERNKRVAEMLEVVGLGELSNRYVHQLSGGQQQRVALARALAIQPRMLLLDEPLSALDAKVRLALRSEIRRIQREFAITTIYVTHDQDEALVLSDRVVEMNQGHVEQAGTPVDIYENPRTPFVATFVGTINVFHAKVVDGGKGLVSVGGQLIQLESDVARLIRESGVTEPRLAIRPEKITLASQPGSNHLTLRVESVSFLGALVQVCASLGDQTLILTHLSDEVTEQIASHQALDVYFSPNAVKVLDQDKGKST